MGERRPLRHGEYLYERELEVLRKIAEAGSELAPAAALFFCATHGVDVPKWLVGSAASGYCKQLNSGRPKKRGRSTGAIERCRQDMIDLIRWDTVKTARHKQADLLEDVLALENYPAVPASYADGHKKMLAWIGQDWLRVWECASMMLQGTPAFAGPDAMKTSYCRVESNKHSWRYFLFDPEFLESIGLHILAVGAGLQKSPHYMT